MESNVRNTIGECNCRLLDALERWAEGGNGLRMAAPCFWGMPLQTARRIIMVGSRWGRDADGDAVALGNAIADLREAAPCYWGTQSQICERWRRVVGECNCRLLGAL